MQQGDKVTINGEEWEVISTYSRAQAIEDGVLVDVSEAARAAGIKYPTALTKKVWDEYVTVPEGIIGQDEAGRLWDILWMFMQEIRRSKGGDELYFKLHVRNDNRDRTPPLRTLKALCGPGDEAEPVITIMFPEET